MFPSSQRSYYIGYRSVDPLDSIIFFYNYFFTWSLAIFCSLILPIFFLFGPWSFQTKRTSHFFLVSFICLANMSCLYIQPYMFAGSGEPNLSLDLCRFLVYLSAFAKPMGLYLTLLFSLERVASKVSPGKKFRFSIKRIYLLSIILIITSILSIRLWEILKYIQGTSSKILSTNLANRDFNFRYCYRSMSKENYAKILSFYIVDNWLEYIVLSLIALIYLFLFGYKFCLPYIQHRRVLSSWSVNTKFYFSLSSCILLFEFSLLVLHFIIGNEVNDNTDTQVNCLQTMMLIYNIRCIALPLIICFTCCQPFQQGIYQFVILRNYLDKYDENERNNQMMAMINSSDTTF